MSSTPTASTPSPSPAEPKPQDDSIKETFESIIIAFILAFVFRAYVVEAFVIPTGSMAPTLLGDHLRLTCRQCGYHTKVDRPGDEKSGAVKGRRTAVDLTYHCPMCQYENVLERGTNVSSGDRILVHKYLYSINEPRRWDVVVFKAPHRPQINYIKRLVGLPQQDTMIIEGNVYYNAEQGNESAWRIARKTDPRENPHAEKIQRAVWQPIYHSEFVPLDYDPAKSDNRWRSPWVIADAGDANAKAWKRSNATAEDAELDPRGGYAFKSDKHGAIRFAFPRMFHADSAGLFSYGQHHPRLANPMEDSGSTIGLEDIRLAAAVEAWQPGLNLSMQTTTRLDDPKGLTHRLTAMIDANGQATISRSDQDKPLASAQVGAFVSGKTRVVEFWYVDQEASLWIDGDRVLVVQFDDIDYVDLLKRPLPFTEFETPELREEHARMNAGRQVPLYVPVVKIQVEGSPTTLHRIDLDRDLHYISTGRGTYHKPYEPNSAAYGSAVHLRADEFYCLGDNSPFSADSRLWESTDPWVLRYSFAPQTPEKESVGIVPRRLMMGKAFFVYFPSLISTTPQGTPFIPNFGEMRFIK